MGKMLDDALKRSLKFEDCQDSCKADNIWNAAIEACVDRLRNDVYHEAQDTEWDLEFNKAKAMCIAELEKEKK